jgi:hypothetical protein
MSDPIDPNPEPPGAPAGVPTASPLIEIDPKFAKAIDPASPPPVRMMAARGIVPGAKPADILAIQYSLSFDPIEAVAAAASKALVETPPNLLKGAIDAKTHPGILDVLARARTTDEDLMEFLVLRKQVSDSTLEFVAEHCGILNIVEIVGKNQERLLQNPKILDALKKNPVSPKSLIDVTIAFLQMAGVLPSGAEARAAGLPDRIDAKILDQILGDEVFDEALTSDDANAQAEDSKTLLQKIGDLTVSQKVKLAYKANKETRAILLRETNRIVVGAVMNSGRLTDGEVIAMSMNPVTASEILRGIDKNRDWVKNYQVQKALACNPKTPQSIAMRWVKALRYSDLQALSRSPNVPAGVKALARQLYEEKNKHR